MLTLCDKNIPTMRVIEVYFCMGAATFKAIQAELTSGGGGGVKSQFFCGHSDPLGHSFQEADFKQLIHENL